MSLRKLCDMWAVSRKRTGKYVAMERLFLGSQLITKQTKPLFRNQNMVPVTTQQNNGTVRHGDSYPGRVAFRRVRDSA
jgi:hypothetical protein